MFEKQQKGWKWFIKGQVFFFSLLSVIRVLRLFPWPSSSQCWQVLLFLWGPVGGVSLLLLPLAHLLPISSSSFRLLKIGSVVHSPPDHWSFSSGNKHGLRCVVSFVLFLQYVPRFSSGSHLPQCARSKSSQVLLPELKVSHSFFYCCFSMMSWREDTPSTALAANLAWKCSWADKTKINVFHKEKTL